MNRIPSLHVNKETLFCGKSISTTIITGFSVLMLSACGGSSGSDSKTGAANSGEYVIDSIDIYLSESDEVGGRYEFSYDANGNTKSSEIYKKNDSGDMEKILGWEYRYDNIDRMVYSRYYTTANSSSETESSSECSFSYELGKTQSIRTEVCYDVWDGEDDGVEKRVVVFTANESGYTVSTADYSASFKGAEFDLQTYTVAQVNSAGDRLLETEYSDIEATRPSSETRYTYDNNGWLILVETDESYDGRINYSVSYQNDEKGNVVYIAEDMDMDGTIDEETRQFYDTNGRIKTATVDGIYGDIDGVVDMKLVYNWHQESVRFSV